MKNYCVLILLLITMLMFSCINDVPEDFDSPDSNWNPSFSFPVGYASLGMDQESGFDTLLFLIDPLSGFPFWIDEINVPISFTMPFNIQEINDFSEEIVSILFRLNTQNGFPNQVKFQFYFQDINSFNIDSFFVNGPLTFDSATPIGSGEFMNSTSNQTDIFIDQNKIKELESVQYILIEGLINNVALDSSLISYYPNYNFDLQLGVQVELNMSISN